MSAEVKIVGESSRAIQWCEEHSCSAYPTARSCALFKLYQAAFRWPAPCRMVKASVLVDLVGVEVDQ